MKQGKIWITIIMLMGTMLALNIVAATIQNHDMQVKLTVTDLQSNRWNLIHGSYHNKLIETQIIESNHKIPLDISKIPTFWGNISSFNEISLNMTVTRTTNITYMDDTGKEILLNKTDIYFTSHFNHGVPVRIFTAIVKPIDDLPRESATGVVIVHGLGGSHKQALPLAERFAARGMITISIDLPGHGGHSTGTVNISATAFIQEDPRNSLLYHDVIATYRAITLLLTFPEVDPSKVILTGGSFGGIMTFITSALDPRIKAAIPLIAAGDWETSIRAGSYLKALIPDNVSFSSPRLKTFIQNFDPLIYAAHINKPILMSIGTKDEFFIPSTANKTFAIIPTQNKNILLLPNVVHKVDERFIETAEEWIEYYVNNDSNKIPPVITVSFTKEKFIHRETLKINVNIETTREISKVELVVREKIPGYSWFIKKIDKNSKRQYEARWEAPIHGRKIQFFVIIQLKSGAMYSSILWEIQLKSNLVLPFWLLIYSILIVPPITFLYHNTKRFLQLKPEEKHKYIQYRGSMHFFPFIFQLLLLVTLFYIPWYSVSVEGFGTLSWTLWQFIDFFLYIDPLPWMIFLYAILTTTGIILEPKKTVLITPIVPVFFFLLGLITVGFEGIGLGLYLALTAVILQGGIIGTLIYRTRQHENHHSIKEDSTTATNITHDHRNDEANADGREKNEVEPE